MHVLLGTVDYQFNLKKVGLLPVHVRVEHFKLNHMYKVINGSAPKYLHSHIKMGHKQHNHNTRASVLVFL